MDPAVGWFQPEQEGPAKDLWCRIWAAHKSGLVDNLKIGGNEVSRGHDLNSVDGFSHSDSVLKRVHSNHFLGLNHNSISANNKASTITMNSNQAALIGKHGGCPWRTPNRVYDRRGPVGLHQEIEEFFQFMSPTEEEHNMRLGVVKKIKNVIHNLWPKAIVEVFGSFATGLYLPTSDIDLVVIGNWSQLPLHTLENALLDAKITTSGKLRVLDRASVPIIKLTDEASDVKVDISFNMNNGVKSAQLIKEYALRYPVLGKLVLVLKQYLLERNLNEVFTGGISSYSLILMIISFLQLHPRQPAEFSEQNLGTLLIEFFELYGRKFNYMKTAIRVKDGGSYIAKEEVQKDLIDGHRTSMLCIEDPLTPGNDIGKGSYGVVYVKTAFEFAYLTLASAMNLSNLAAGDANEHSILGRIVKVTDEVINYRNWIKVNFPIRHFGPMISGSMSISSGSSEGSVSSMASSDSDSECGDVRLKTGQLPQVTFTWGPQGRNTFHSGNNRLQNQHNHHHHHGHHHHGQRKNLIYLKAHSTPNAGTPHDVLGSAARLTPNMQHQQQQQQQQQQHQQQQQSGKTPTNNNGSKLYSNQNGFQRTFRKRTLSKPRTERHRNEGVHQQR